uniref:Short-chain dehydrogenase/reductase SDR n=1 Tax=mine drainage metagenome TaxID=410659 RepID=E6PR94_9ZZZZ
MTRLALITGGTRGTGAAIARRLQQDGCRAAVTYRGNEVAAKAFRDATAIAADPWDASDFGACFNMMAAVDPKVLKGVVAQIPVGRWAGWPNPPRSPTRWRFSSTSSRASSPAPR